MTTMRSRPATPQPQAQRGFTILELLVAMTVAAFILGAALKLLVDDSRVYHSQTQLSEMRQNARNALEFVARDVMPVGYGLLTDDAAVVPVLIANEPAVLNAATTTTMTVRYNATDVWSTLTADMASAGADVEVALTTGFSVGQRVLIWDDGGNSEWMTVSAIDTSTKRLSHAAALSKAYAAGARVAAITEIVYKYEPATMRLQRQQDQGTWLTVAENVQSMSFKYWDKDGNALAPADDATRLKVRKITVALSAMTAQTDRVSGGHKTYQLATELTPRNLQALHDI